MKLTVVLTMWQGWRPLYEPRHCTAMANMLRTNIDIDFRIVLLTDIVSECEGIDEVWPMPAEPRGLVPTAGPNCWRRLRLFDPAYNRRFGTPWIWSLDLDTIIWRNITDLVEWATTQDAGICLLKGRQIAYPKWQKELRPYNGAMTFLECGRHSYVWYGFEPKVTPQYLQRKGWIGSDQVWLSTVVEGAPTFDASHGCYYLGEYRERDEDSPLPRIINYAGPTKPWSKPNRRDNPELWEAYRRHYEDPWSQATAS